MLFSAGFAQKQVVAACQSVKSEIGEQGIDALFCVAGIAKGDGVSLASSEHSRNFIIDNSRTPTQKRIPRETVR
jgi:hypothetical protein